MKSTKFQKLASLLLAAIMVLAMAAPAMAADPGKITITNNTDTGAEADGRKFIAYQILTVTLAEDNTPSYAVPASMKDWYETHFFSVNAFAGKSDAEVNAMVIGKIAEMTTASAIEQFAKDALAAAQAAPGIYKTVEFSGGVTQDVPYGYYVIEQTYPATQTDGQAVSAVMVDTTMPTVSIPVKADTHKITKEIVTDGSEPAKSDDASIGDIVSYQVTTKVPDMTGYVKYVFQIQDTLSKGLTFDGNVRVTMGTGTAAVALVSDTDYTVWQDPDNAQIIKVIFTDFIKWKDVTPSVIGQPIVVTYDAILNDEAAIGVEGNPNEVELLYSNDPSYKGTGNPDDPKTDVPHGKTPKSKTRTFATGIDLTKIDSDGNPLVGAEFVLKGNTINQVVVYQEVFVLDADSGTYWKLKDGTYTMQDPTSLPNMDKDKYESLTDLYKIVTDRTIDTKDSEFSITATVGADGKLRLDGLSEGTYTLTETKAPNGYNILTDSITLVISADLPDNETDDATWYATMQVGSKDAEDVTFENGRLKISVMNNKGSELPSTGGMGTTLFTIGGLVLMAGVVLLALRRRSGATK